MTNTVLPNVLQNDGRLDIVYIVSGYMRSGTSMMMKALEAGGMEAVYSKERDARMNFTHGSIGYKPNASYMEMEFDDYRDKDFPKKFRGKLIKCLYGGIQRISADCNYRLIFMRRKTLSIQKSMYTFFGAPGHSQRMDFEAMLERTVEIARDRRSFLSVDEIWYEDVLKDPELIFNMLASDSGWPIDPNKAAAIPSPDENRFGVQLYVPDENDNRITQCTKGKNDYDPRGA